MKKVQRCLFSNKILTCNKIAEYPSSAAAYLAQLIATLRNPRAGIEPAGIEP